MVNYDSTADTKEHIGKVQARIQECISRLTIRAAHHDESKLAEPERSLLSALGSQTNLPPYGSAEERARFDALAEFRRHHYAENSHHPEHYTQGIEGMSLLDIIEMLCDWEAAGARHVSGNIHDSLKFNIDRFGINPQLAQVLENTVKELKW